MKKTHISARDYEILVSGQGKTLDQVINNVGSNNRGDDLIPITIVPVEEVAQYIYDTYQSSVAIPVLQKFLALNNGDESISIDIELFNNDTELLSDIIENYEGFDNVEYVKAVVINDLQNDEFTWILPFIISHNITNTVIFTTNSIINRGNVPSSFPSSHILRKINIGQIKKSTGAMVNPVKIIKEYYYGIMSSDDFSYIEANMKIETDSTISADMQINTNTLNATYFMDNESKFIFKASIHQA